MQSYRMLAIGIRVVAIVCLVADRCHAQPVGGDQPKGLAQDGSEKQTQPQPPRLKLVKRVQAKNGETVLTVNGPWQKTDTTIHVLVPDNLATSTKLRVLYVLPVEAGEGTRWGRAFSEIIKLDLHNKYQLLCVYPTFSMLPWYADHPTDSNIRQELHFIKGIIPFIDANFPTTAAAKDRLLVGFSKSGWGAVSLLLRHSKVVGRAAGWDAPFVMTKSGRFGSGPIFGTQQNFDEHYDLSKTVAKHAAKFREQPRLIHLGYGNFKDHHIQFEALLNQHNVSHIYRHGPQRKHEWRSGWLLEAVELLVQ